MVLQFKGSASHNLVIFQMQKCFNLSESMSVTYHVRLNLHLNANSDQFLKYFNDMQVVFHFSLA